MRYNEVLLTTKQMNRMLDQTSKIESVIKPDEIPTLGLAIVIIKSLIELQKIAVDCVHEYHNALDKIVTIQEVERATQQ
jgi:hypothetical protein